MFVVISRSNRTRSWIDFIPTPWKEYYPLVGNIIVYLFIKHFCLTSKLNQLFAGACDFEWALICYTSICIWWWMEIIWQDLRWWVWCTQGFKPPNLWCTTSAQSQSEFKATAWLISQSISLHKAIQKCRRPHCEKCLFLSTLITTI